MSKVEGWVAKRAGWVAKHPRVTVALGIRLQTYKWATKAKEWPTHFSPAKKYTKEILETTTVVLSPILFEQSYSKET